MNNQFTENLQFDKVKYYAHTEETLRGDEPQFTGRE